MQVDARGQPHRRGERLDVSGFVGILRQILSRSSEAARMSSPLRIFRRILTLSRVNVDGVDWDKTISMPPVSALTVARTVDGLGNIIPVHNASGDTHIYTSDGRCILPDRRSGKLRVEDEKIFLRVRQQGDRRLRADQTAGNLSRPSRSP